METWAARVWGWIACAWDWIGRNQGPLAVLVTLGGVLVAWRYVVLTRRLAEAARDQAGAAKEQAEASRMAAQAAADQARVTRLMFEANRPVLRIHSEHNFLPGATPQVFDHALTFALVNSGTAPATVTGWDLTVKRGGQIIHETHKDAAGLGISVPPEPSSDTVPAFIEQIPHLFRDGGGPVEVEAKVTYRGAGGKGYWTRHRWVLSPTLGNVTYVALDTAMDEG